jgi:ABC-type oligopeptide transport system substrate-binding subunit
MEESVPMKLRLLTCALAACVALIFSGPALAQKKGGDVIIAMQAAPPSLDPHVTSAQVARNINLHVFETLYAYGNARPVPDLAEGGGLSRWLDVRVHAAAASSSTTAGDGPRTSSHRWSATGRSALRQA